MLFSQSKCFFKRQRTFPPILDLKSSPTSSSSLHSQKSPSDSTSSKQPPYERSYSKRTVSNEIAQPPKAYAANHYEAPTTPYADPVPTWNRKWSFSDTSTATPSLSETPTKSARQRNGFWSRLGILNSGSFRNAGLDENGRLKGEYEETQDTDWGVPDDWLPCEQKSRY